MTGENGPHANERDEWSSNHEMAAKSFASPDYARQRLNPEPGDEFYLHLSDLLLAIKRLIPQGAHRVLDFGSGVSPYRPLFGDCTYHRADLAGISPDVDFEFGLDSLLPVPATDYDCVLSTQVLEHVKAPEIYLAECRRVLKPGGRLILSTHGAFEDHAFPHDYWRWTIGGLKTLVESTGFFVEHCKKLTTGPRAAIFIAQREQFRFRFNRVRPHTKVGIYSWMLHIGAGLFRKFGRWRLHKACDANLSEYRVIDINEPNHNIYIAIILVARCT
jgi:SAM-dependent methyltransferase